ncbi:uncharacterized protein LY89DRAFT_739539 [Mollisia scopiformis]|uniref:Survival protein SurE-like phosphatase/nucleotidase domain-containing protein n=1 Tax=Mollisia scopiformis TaxID=149040 RepID=A0A194WUP8_MOLSC|nr:uncharacterized protein LY89DRAFT_739539 [Mollisia scopiformis]KUJ11342.1 hypothetical protein LY89DRAFT_739539 [Mollisia scopiformis]
MLSPISSLLIPLAFSAPAFPPPAELTQGIINANISLIAGGGAPNVSIILNITNGVYDTGDRPLNETLSVIEKIAAQEEVHVATVSGIFLESKQSPPVTACNYTFPVTNFDEFLSVANLITCANFGSIIGIQEQLPGSTASGPAGTSILATETRHDSFLRILHGIAPNPSPFDTAVPAAWAYNVGLQFIVPGSCGVEPAYPAYPQLTVTSMEGQSFAHDTSYPSSVSFAWDPQQAWVPMYTEVVVNGTGSGSTMIPKNMSGMAFMALTTMQPADFTNLGDATLVGPIGISIS